MAPPLPLSLLPPLLPPPPSLISPLPSHNTNLDVAPSSLSTLAMNSNNTMAGNTSVDTAEEEANGYMSTATSESRPMSPEILSRIRYDNITYEVLRPEELGCDIKDIPLFGERRSKARTARTKKIPKQKPEEVSEAEWEDKRRVVIEERLFNREYAGYSKTDMTTTEDGLQLPKLPAWLNATREFQSDGSPGVFLCRPNQKDFEGRFLDILEALEPIGVEIGVVKICIPDECLDEPIPWSEFKRRNFYSSKSPEELSPDETNFNTPTTSISSTSTSSDSSIVTEFHRRPNKYASIIPPAEIDEMGIPQVYSMDQRLPLHAKSRSNIAPVYHVTSTPKTLVSGARWRKDVIFQLERERRIAAGDPNVQVYASLTEDVMVARGRKWVEVIQGDKGGISKYSSDNDASGELRAYLGLGNPRLTELPGNVIHDSKIKVTGIHTPYLYIGKAYTLFALHAEDYNALSLNYQHLGAPKTWRVVCPRDFHLVESFVAGIIHPPSSSRKKMNKCSQFVRHASIYLPKQTLEIAGARSVQFRQNPGELVVTWPLAYHEGWNEGVNVNEACGYGHIGWRKVFASGEEERGEEKIYRPCGARCIGDIPPIILDFGPEGMGEEFDTEDGESNEGAMPEMARRSMSTISGRKRSRETGDDERGPLGYSFSSRKKLKIVEDEEAVAVNSALVFTEDIKTVNKNIVKNNPEVALHYEPKAILAEKTIEERTITKHIMMHREQGVGVVEGDEDSMEDTDFSPVQLCASVGEGVGLT